MIDPLLKESELDPLAETEDGTPVDGETAGLDDEDEEVDDYDSFDDRDEM